MNYKPIKTEFRWTGDGFGNANARLIKQVKRVGDVAIYERTVENSGRQDGYEVIRILRHNGYTLGGQTVAPAETYPGATQFGKNAWSEATLKSAEVRFNQILATDKARADEDAKAAAAGTVVKRRGRPRKAQ